MRILYITLENLSLQKGSVTHVKEIVRGLRKRGHRVDLVARCQDKFEGADRFYNLHPPSLFLSRFFCWKKVPYVISSVFLFVYLFKLLPKNDIIYVREYPGVILSLFPRWIFGKKLVFEINGLASEEQRLKGPSLVNRFLSFAIQNTERIATRFSDRIVSVTPQLASYVERNFYCRPEKVEVIGNGVNTEHFRPISDHTVLSRWREKLGILQGDRVVVFVGNLAPWQGVDVLLEAAFRLLSREKRLKFVIVGEGLLKHALTEKARASEFGRNVIFTGMLNYEEVPVLINLADICVAPFISKRNKSTGVSPLKVFEYMACGKPIVASRIAGLEFLEKEQAGRLTEPEDVIGLEKTIGLLLRDPQSRTMMGQKGGNIAREGFSWELKASKIAEILEEMA